MSRENVVGDIENSPIILWFRETMKDVLTEALDLEGLKNVFNWYRRWQHPLLGCGYPNALGFLHHEILNANPYAYLDDAPLEERRARAVEMRRVLPQAIAEEFGRLDPAAIAEVREDAWPFDVPPMPTSCTMSFSHWYPSPESGADIPANTHLQATLAPLNRRMAQPFRRISFPAPRHSLHHRQPHSLALHRARQNFHSNLRRSHL